MQGGIDIHAVFAGLALVERQVFIIQLILGGIEEKYG
jgi:hypothetical protein